MLVAYPKYTSATPIRKVHSFTAASGKGINRGGPEVAENSPLRSPRLYGESLVAARVLWANKQTHAMLGCERLLKR